MSFFFACTPKGVHVLTPLYFMSKKIESQAFDIKQILQEYLFLAMSHLKKAQFK